MRNNFLTFLGQLGIFWPWKYLSNGLIGGFVWALYKKLKFWDSVRQIFVGGIVSAYSTPVIASKFSLQDAGFISFVVGIIGLVLIEVLYKWAVKKIKLLFE